jgi:hypothetical protein
VNAPITAFAEWRDYFALLKPRVMTLVVFTAACAMIAAPGTIHPFLGFTAILCIAVAAGASGALNQWYEADIDALMKRTANRPLPAGKMEPHEALNFAIALSIGSVAIMGLAVNWVAAFWLAVSILFVVAKPVAATVAPQSGIAAAMISIIAFTVAMGVAARLPVENTVKTEAFASQGLKAIDLAFESWKGRTFADAGVARHLPRLTAETLEGDAIVVFYNPKCGQCHEVFDRWLAAGRSEKIIAVMVPAAEGATEAAGDGDIGDITCPSCVRLELPKGPTWLITTPSVAVLKDGVIRCTADKDFTSCLGAPPAP